MIMIIVLCRLLINFRIFDYCGFLFRLNAYRYLILSHFTQDQQVVCVQDLNCAYLCAVNWNAKKMHICVLAGVSGILKLIVYKIKIIIKKQIK